MSQESAMAEEIEDLKQERDALQRQNAKLLGLLRRANDLFDAIGKLAPWAFVTKRAAEIYAEIDRAMREGAAKQDQGITF